MLLDLPPELLQEIGNRLEIRDYYRLKRSCCLLYYCREEEVGEEERRMQTGLKRNPALYLEAFMRSTNRVSDGEWEFREDKPFYLNSLRLNSRDLNRKSFDFLVKHEFRRELCRLGREFVVKFNIPPYYSKNRLIKWACTLNDVALVEWLLQYHVNYPTHPARLAGDSPSTVKHRSSSTSTSTPSSIEFNEGLIRAVNEGHVEVVKLLLLDHRVNPSFNGNQAILFACHKGHASVVRELLNHPSTDPSVNNNRCLRNACNLNHIETARLLLHHPKVDPTVNDNHCLESASISGNLEIILALLDHGMVDGRRAIGWSCESGKESCVQRLLEDGRSDPNYDEGWPLRMASKNGHVGIIRILLSDGRVDPTARSNRALVLAVRYKHWEVAALLVRDSRVAASGEGAGDDSEDEEDGNLFNDDLPPSSDEDGEY